MEITKVKINNLEEEKRFSQLIAKLIPDNDKFKNVSSELQEYIQQSAYDDGYIDAAYTRVDGNNPYFEHYYPIGFVFCDDDQAEIDFLNYPMYVTDWYWEDKNNMGSSKDYVSVDKFERVFTDDGNNEHYYFIGGGDPYGNNCPNDLFNKTYVPRLRELGIKDDCDMYEVANMFEEIYSIGHENGMMEENFNASESC